jgi:hypothetical protein
MRAHQLDANSVIINTIVVDSLDALPDLIDASIGGSAGDRIIDGAVIPKPLPQPTKEELNAPILAQLAVIDAKSIRALREGDAARISALEYQAANLRTQLIK